MLLWTLKKGCQLGNLNGAIVAIYYICVIYVNYIMVIINCISVYSTGSKFLVAGTIQRSKIIEPLVQPVPNSEPLNRSPTSSMTGPILITITVLLRI